MAGKISKGMRLNLTVLVKSNIGQDVLEIDYARPLNYFFFKRPFVSAIFEISS